MQQAVQAVASGAVIKQELLLNLPVGGWRWFDFVLRPIFSAEGDVMAIVPEAQETTDRRAAEEALRQSQKLEAMGQLTGGVAHDFNNLLTPIIGTLDLLSRRGFGGEREQRLIKGGLQSAERARTLVQRLLAFARRQPLQPQPVDVAALIRSMSDLIASTSGPRIRIDLAIREPLPAATAEVNQLEMALLNLAVNARDAMSAGGTLTIGASAQTIAADARPGLAGVHQHGELCQRGHDADGAPVVEVGKEAGDHGRCMAHVFDHGLHGTFARVQEHRRQDHGQVVVAHFVDALILHDGLCQRAEGVQQRAMCKGHVQNESAKGIDLLLLQQ